MRRLARSLALALVSLAIVGAGQSPQRYASFTPEQRATLKQISDYLNGIRTLEGGFMQLDPNGGVEQGQFYLSKPGRMRFAYQPPDPLLIVSDGTTIAIQNAKLKTVDHYPLSDTPLDLILTDKIDLNQNLSITGMSMESGAIVIRAKSQSSHAEGNIAIEFSEEPLELRQWTVVDAQGLSTTVSLKDIQTGIALPDSLFVLADAKTQPANKTPE